MAWGEFGLGVLGFVLGGLGRRELQDCGGGKQDSEEGATVPLVEAHPCAAQFQNTNFNLTIGIPIHWHH